MARKISERSLELSIKATTRAAATARRAAIRASAAIEKGIKEVLQTATANVKTAKVERTLNPFLAFLIPPTILENSYEVDM